MFTGIGAVVAGFFGSGVGLLQGIIDKKQETRRFEIEKQLDNERIKIENNANIEIARAGIDIEKYKHLTATSQEKIAQSQQLQSEYENFTKAQIEATKNDGGWSKKMRPMFSVGFFALFAIQLMGVILLALGVFPEFAFLREQAWLQFIVMNEFVLYTLDYIIGYWFVRRSTEKQFFLKKKS